MTEVTLSRDGRHNVANVRRSELLVPGLWVLVTNHLRNLRMNGFEFNPVPSIYPQITQITQMIRTKPGTETRRWNDQS